ncbi:MAG: cyclase family protein [Acidobacteria bacterium]|nr:cyclase family protein [Acidobacteriota bacterium]
MNRRELLTSLAAAAAVAPLDAAPAKATKADVERWMKELSNWGRWGQQDQLGTINLITPAKRKEAAGLVREGVSVSLAHPVEKKNAVDNGSPFEHRMEDAGIWAHSFVLDSYHVNYHGFAHTHIDALCHMFINGKMYNGHAPSTVTKQGASQLAISAYRDGLFTRGVLMDIPALKGKKYLDLGEAIHPEDLDAWEKKSGVKVRAGDAVLIHTGRWIRRAEKGPWDASKQCAGLYGTCAKWFKQRDMAILGSDAASDVAPSGVDGVAQPIHQLSLVAMGMPILDNLDLTAVSAQAAKSRRWEFLLTAAPLVVEGGTGSPLNPIATF